MGPGITACLFVAFRHEAQIQKERWKMFCRYEGVPCESRNLYRSLHLHTM